MAGALAQEPARSAYAVELASTFGAWVHRRVETFEFPGADTVRRRMSVDFTLPADPSLEEGTRIAVPLMILRREVLRNFDVMDEEGRRLSVLTTNEHRDVALTGLRELLGARPPDDSRLNELLERLVGRRSHGEWVSEHESPRAELEASIETMLEPDVFEVLRGLLAALENGFLLLTELEYKPGERRLIKFSYDSPLNPDRGFWAWAYRKLSNVASGLGWIARMEEFEDIQVGWAESYHVEAAPPVDTWPAESTLEIDGGPVRDRHRRHYLRPHLAVGGCQPGETAQFTLLLHPRRDVLILPLLVASVAIATILAAVPGHRAELDGQTLGALLLVPFALSAFYVRPGEHSYVSRALLGLRLLAAVVVAAGVLVLALLALGELDCEGPGVVAAEWAARAAAVAAYLVLVAYVIPTLARPARVVIGFVGEQTAEWGRVWRISASAALVAIFVLPIVAVGCWVYSVLPF